MEESNSVKCQKYLRIFQRKSTEKIKKTKRTNNLINVVQKDFQRRFKTAFEVDDNQVRG